VTTGAALVAAHREAGSTFTAGGVRSFVRAEGNGEPVVCMHGLPASSFLYRKVLPLLADRGLRGVAFDLPGLGLAEHPAGFDYRLGGLGDFAAAAVDALELGPFHLVVHDAGGPVGFELVRRRPGLIRSLTILNTMVEIPSTPFPGELLARTSRRVGSWMAAPRMWELMMYRVGVADRSALNTAEADAYRLLALGDDGGAGYLNIMRNVRASATTGSSYRDVVDTRRIRYPVQVVWGARDPILSLRRRGLEMLGATGLDQMTVVPGKHFIQEDCAPAVATAIDRMARSGSAAG
jgi:haloalkane dehalogenase